MTTKTHMFSQRGRPLRQRLSLGVNVAWPMNSTNGTNNQCPGACHPGEKGKDYMKTQRIVKGGAAIGSAIALLLISVLLAPSPAPAKENWIQDPNSKLIPTGVEPAASGRTHASGEWSDLMLPWGFYFDGEVTGSCRDLTPSTTYTITVTEGYTGALAGTVSAVASETGDFTFACGVWSDVPFPSLNIFSIQVANDAGQIVLEGAFHIHWNHY